MIQSDVDGAWDVYAEVVRERDALRTEVERLQWIEKAAIAWANVVESHPDDGTESEAYVDSAHAIFHVLGRTACESCEL